MNISLFLAAMVGVTLSMPLTEPAPLWGDDTLIWDMSENSTYYGTGYTYCDGIVDTDVGGKQYAVSIVDSTGTQGDVVKIFIYDNIAQVWSLANIATGGPWVLTDPQLMLHGQNSDPDSNFISIFITATYPDSSAGPLGFRLIKGDFTFDGFMQPPWVPGVDTLESISVVCQPEDNEMWLFGENTDNTIWLTRSTDNGETWTDLELIAENAERPSAELGPGDWIYMAYKRTSDDMLMCTSFSDDSYYETEITQGSATSSPICASERTGAEMTSVIFHDQNFDIRMALSDDNGATWSLSPPIAKGIYPYIDVYRSSASSALAYLDVSTETVFFANAGSLALLPGQRPDPVSGQFPYMNGPPVVRHGVLPTEVDIFYMGRGDAGQVPRDLWYDNSLLTPHGVSGDPIQPAVSAGPNPFTTWVGMSFTLDAQAYCTLDIYSLDGRLVERVYSGTTNGESLQAGANLPAGVYNAVFRNGDSMEVSRLVKI